MGNKRYLGNAAVTALFLIICFGFAGRAFASREIKPISAVAAETPSPVPVLTPTPRPVPTPWNQLGISLSPSPEPTSDPMIQKWIREDVEKAFVIDIMPTPATPAKNKALSLEQAADRAIETAKTSFKSLEIARLNIQKQVGSLRDSVNMAIQALEADDRYKVLAEAEDRGDILDEELFFELEMYKAMRYKELTSDERRQLISVRDMGYERFNLNITKIDYNIEIMRNQLKFAAYAQFAGIAKMQAAVAIQQDALDLQYKNLEILRKRYELGSATRVEVENAEISYEKAKLEIGKQKRSLASLETGFNKLIGENLATTYQDFDRSKLAPSARKMDEPVEKYVARALANRSEALLAKAELSLAKRQSDLYETEITKFGTLDDKQDAAQAAEEAEITYDITVQDIEAEIKSAYKQLVALRGVTVYYESQISAAQGNYERTQKLYELGMATAVSVDQVRMSLSQAKMQLENNMIDVWQQLRKLDIICGIGPKL